MAIRNIARLSSDIQYLFLNSIVNKIPIWIVRKTIYRACGMKIGKDARIGIGTIIYCPEKIVIGDRSIINEKCYLDGRFGIDINHDVGVSIFSKIITGTHVADSETFQYSGEKVTIRHHSWLGAGAIILPGSRIAECSVIGAGAVYKGRSQKGDIIVGNPGKVIRKRKCRMSYKLCYAPFFR